MLSFINFAVAAEKRGESAVDSTTKRIKFYNELNLNLSNCRNSIGTLPDRRIKVLLLGVMASGKTELGYILSRQQRENFEPTNGVQFYRIELPERYVSITEVGGNTEIQKIWHHYFLTTMGIIYCFDMSTSYEKLRDSFDCLRRTLMHPYVRGKPVLLVATKADLADEGIQLFDIENTFQLEALAKYYLSSAHVCYVGKNICMDNLWNGFGWFVKYIIDNMDQLQMRLKTDANLEVKIMLKLMAIGSNCV